MGNQMFQYAFGRSISERYGRPLYVETSLLKRPNTIPREYALGNFKLNSEIVTSEKLAASAKRIGVYARISQSSRGFQSAALADPCIPLAIYDGHWQSPRYFDNISDSLHLDFSSTFTCVDNSLRPIIDSIRQEQSVCLHVRRGDYLHPGSPIKAVGLSYFQTAVTRLRGQLRAPVYFIFSDDLDWCRAQLNLPDLCVLCRCARLATIRTYGTLPTFHHQ